MNSFPFEFLQGGLMRDVVTHKPTTYEHWVMLQDSSLYSPSQRSYESVVADGIVTPQYDPNCIEKVREGCQPVAVLSAEHLVDPTTGPAENHKLAETLYNKPGIGDYLAPEDEWECLWAESTAHEEDRGNLSQEMLQEIIDDNERLITKYSSINEWDWTKSVQLRLQAENSFQKLKSRTSLFGGGEKTEINFSEEMLQAMINEYERLILKYSSKEWISRQTAQDLTYYLNEHLVQLNKELTEVQSGVRVLKVDDFLGPDTRKRLKYATQLRGAFASAMESRRNLLKKIKEDENDFYHHLDMKFREARRKLLMRNPDHLF